MDGPGFSRKNMWVLVQGGTIVSFAQVFNRRMWNREVALKFTGLGMVCTHPRFRGSGYASALIRHIIHKNKSDVIGLLTRKPAFYKRFQFAAVPRAKIIITKGRWLKAAGDTVKIRKFDRMRDIMAVASIHKKYFKACTGATVRSLGDWRAQLSYFNEEKRLFLVLMHNGAAAAYVRCKWSGSSDDIEIVEFAAVDKKKPYMAHFVSWIFARFPVRSIKGQGLFFPDDIAASGPYKKETDSLLMWRINKKRPSLPGSGTRVFL